MLTHRSTTGTDSELPRSESLSSTEKHAHDDSLQGDKEKDKIDVESLVALCCDSLGLLRLPKFVSCEGRRLSSDGRRRTPAEGRPAEGMGGVGL